MERDRKEQLLALYENGHDEVFEEVLSLYEEALKEDPNNLILKHRYGYIFEVRGRRFLKKAAAIYEDGVKQSIENLKETDVFEQVCHGQLIKVRKALGEVEKSVDLYKEYIEKDPTNEYLYTNLTNSYLTSNQLDEAKVTIDSADKLFPDNSLIFYWKGEVYAALGKIDEGMIFLEKSLQYNNDLIDSRFTLAYLFEREGKIEEAKKQWGLIIEWLKGKGYKEECEYPERELKRLENIN